MNPAGSQKMFSVPVTFVFAFTAVNETLRPYILHEFAANGAKHLVLSSSLMRALTADWNLAAALRREMAAEGLTFCDAHAPFRGLLDLNCPDADFRPQMILRHKTSIRMAASFGVDTITIHLGSNRPHPEIPLEKHYDRMRDGLDRILPEAEACGVTVCIENSCSQAACPAAVVRLKNEYRTDTLGLCYDSGHAHLLDAGRHDPGSCVWGYWRSVGVDEPEWDDRALEKMLPQVVSCHLHDNDGSADSHALPGQGTVNWKKIIPLLKHQAPRLKVIQCEVNLPGACSIREVCAKFAELGEIE